VATGKRRNPGCVYCGSTEGLRYMWTLGAGRIVVCGDPVCASRPIRFSPPRGTTPAIKFFEAYSVGLVCASVCTNMTVEEATAELNRQHPTGIATRWSLSTDKAFRGGEPNPCPCNRHEGRLHYLFNC
jgi:hypothetical protein